MIIDNQENVSRSDHNSNGQERRNTQANSRESQINRISDYFDVDTENIVSKDRSVKMVIFCDEEKITQVEFPIKYHKKVVIEGRKFNDVFSFKYSGIKSDYDVYDNEGNIKFQVEAKKSGNLFSETLSINKSRPQTKSYFNLCEKELGIDKEQAGHLLDKAVEDFIDNEGKSYADFLSNNSAKYILHGDEMHVLNESFDLKAKGKYFNSYDLKAKRVSCEMFKK